MGALGRGDHPLVLVEAGLFDLLPARWRGVLVEMSVMHACSPTLPSRE